MKNYSVSATATLADKPVLLPVDNTKKTRVFTSADLWNIEKQKRNFGVRRNY